MNTLPSLICTLRASRCFQVLRVLRLVGQLVEFGQDWEFWLAPATPAHGRQVEALVEASQGAAREKNHAGFHAHYRVSAAVWAP